MKTLILALAFLLAGVWLDMAAANDSCVCSQWTCTTNVCEGANMPRCRTVRPQGAGYYDGTVDGIVFSLQAAGKYNYTESVAKCKEAGFDNLASVRSEAQFQLLKQMLDTSGYGHVPTNYFHIGYHKEAGCSAFKWASDGSTSVSSTWWAPGEPNNSGAHGTEDADSVSLLADGQFNDGASIGELYRVCQAPLCK